jgi:hypothetical protein
MENFDLKKYLAEGKLLNETEERHTEPKDLEDIGNRDGEKALMSVSREIFDEPYFFHYVSGFIKGFMDNAKSSKNYLDLKETFNPFLDTEEGGYMREYLDDTSEEEELNLDYRDEFEEAFKIALSRLTADLPELDFNLIVQNKDTFF